MAIFLTHLHDLAKYVIEAKSRMAFLAGRRWHFGIAPCEGFSGVL